MVETNVLKSICLADLLNPATFLNSLKQQTARMKGISIDSLDLYCNLEKTNSDAIEIKNLFIQGAIIGSNVLSECRLESIDLQKINMM